MMRYSSSSSSGVSSRWKVWGLAMSMRMASLPTTTVPVAVTAEDEVRPVLIGHLEATVAL